MYSVFITKKALGQFDKLPKNAQKRIKAVLDKLENFPRGLDAKKMAGFRSFYRVRVGKYSSRRKGTCRSRDSP